MLVYANQTDEVADGLPPLATIVSEAMAVQSMTVFCADEGVGASSAATKSAEPNHWSLMSYLSSRLAESRGVARICGIPGARSMHAASFAPHSFLRVQLARHQHVTGASPWPR